MQFGVPGLALSASLAVASSGCHTTDYHALSPHITEGQSRPFFGDSVGGTIKIVDSAVDATMDDLARTYGPEGEDRIAEYCLGMTLETRTRESVEKALGGFCPAPSVAYMWLEYWNITNVDSSTDYRWAATNEAGAKKCNVVLNACLKKELIHPTESLQLVRKESAPVPIVAPLPPVEMSPQAGCENYDRMPYDEGTKRWLSDVVLDIASNPRFRTSEQTRVLINTCLDKALDSATESLKTCPSPYDVDPQDARKKFTTYRGKRYGNDALHFWYEQMGEGFARRFAPPFHQCLASGPMGKP